jgi:hypothetical protein
MIARPFVFALALYLVLGPNAPVRAQDPANQGSVDPDAPGSIQAPPSQALLLAELDRRRPEDTSPFFANREVSDFMNTAAGQALSEQRTVAVYPNTASYDSVDAIFGNFARGLVRSLPFRRESAGQMTALEVVPGTTFVLADRREISATLTVKNQSNKLIALDFDTDQRFDFVIKDASGRELERWSNDRNFAQQQGVVMVNPQERITYTATLSTRDMEAGQTYFLEGSIAGNPDFVHVVELQPR